MAAFQKFLGQSRKLTKVIMQFCHKLKNTSPCVEELVGMELSFIPCMEYNPSVLNPFAPSLKRNIPSRNRTTTDSNKSSAESLQ